MASKNEKKAVVLTRLSKDLNALFLPIIRYRGNRYFKEGRIRLTDISTNFIKAKVRGSAFYKVSIDLKEKDQGAVRIGCTCPFFKQGIPCKHIWATIKEAERYYQEHKQEIEESEKASLVLDVDEIFTPEAWQQEQAAPWRRVQDFVLKYEVQINNNIIQVSAYEEYIKKNGQPGRRRKVNAKILSHPNLPRADRLILPFLASLSSFSHFSYGLQYDTYGDRFSTSSLSPDNVAALLPLLAETKRCIVTLDKEKIVADPLVLAPENDAKFTLKANPSGEEDVELEPEILVGKKRIKATEVCLVNSQPLMMIHQGFLYELSGPSYHVVKKIVKRGIKKTKKKRLPKIVKNAIKLSCIHHLDLPKEIAPKILDNVTPQPILVLKVDGEDILARPFFSYEGLRIDAREQNRLLFNEAGQFFIKRDEGKEKKFFGALKKAGFRDLGEGGLVIDFDSASSALSMLDEAGVKLEAENGKAFKAGSMKRMYISSGIDWFDMDAEVDFGTEAVPLPRVVSAFLRGQKTVNLASGGKGILPSKWLEKHRRILELARTGKDESGKKVLRFPSSHALVIEGLLSEAKEAKTDTRFKQIRQKLKNFKGIKPSAAPKGFRGKLRPYQKEALGWFAFLHELGLGGILADDMGLGKTVQVLAWLKKIKKGSKITAPSLIVAPTSLVFNWQEEAKRFTPDIKLAAYVGPERNKRLKNFKGVDIVLTTYGIVRRDIKALSKMEFNYCILDESQYIKNPDSLTAKACRLLKAHHRLCLTGTPIENHLGELWSQMEFLNPGILGRKEQYMERFAKPAANGNKEVLETLKRIVRPFILRRTKEEVAKDLPEKMESVIRCTMTREQLEIYNQIRDHYKTSIMQQVETKGIKRSKMMVLEGLLRLRQAANHPALLGSANSTSGKFQQLMELLSESVEGGHKVLIFSQFTKMLKLIKDELKKRQIPFEYLDGRTPQAKRKERVENFQDNPEIRAFLISLKAGGFGLNLTAADYVFIVDPWWNPAVELQAVDRTHRIGQTRKVVTYRLITKDSVEEKVLSLQKKKQEIVGSILSGSRSLLTNLTSKDLEILFS